MEIKKIFLYSISFLLILLNLTGCAKTSSITNQNIQEKIMNQDSPITAEYALKELKRVWSGDIKLKLPDKFRDIEGEQGKRLSEGIILFGKSFESRMNNTEWERERNWYTERKISCDADLKKELQEYEQEVLKRGFPGMLYSDYDQFPVKGECWELEWRNLMQGGFVAYIDVSTGKILAIKILIEGI